MCLNCGPTFGCEPTCPNYDPDYIAPPVRPKLVYKPGDWIAMRHRVENLIGTWRRQADDTRTSSPGWSSMLYDVANELEKKVLDADTDNDEAEAQQA